MGCLWASCGLLRPSWSLLGRSWRPLGASLGALGGVWGPLGRLLGHLRGDPNVTKITCPKKINFQTLKCRIGLGNGVQLGTPKSTKIGPKTGQILRRFLRAKKWLFNSVLEPSWVDLGPFWRPSWGQKRRFRIGKRSTSEKITFLMWIGFQNAFWNELGPSWLPKGPKKPPKGPPKTAPNGQKSISKNNQNFDRFSRPAFCRFGPVRRNALASWGDKRGV